MKTIALSKNKGYVMVDDEDYNILKGYKWYVDNRGYVVTYVKTPVGWRSMRIHRVILDVCCSKQEIDHKDRNPLNNQKDNLHLASRSENNRNRRVWGRSKYRGVCIHYWLYHSKKHGAVIKTEIRAQLTFNKQKIFLGTHKTEEAAAMAYDKKAKELFGDRANLNFK